MSKPVAVITGASRGIGRAIAIELAQTHSVIATYRRNREAAESLQQEIGCDIVQSDVGSAADRAALVEYSLNKYGAVDLLVNNAGITQRERRDVLEASETSFDELLNTNLRGPHFLTQAIARGMVARRAGRVVFITSISSYAVSVNRAEYCISKAGLSMSAQIYAQRLAPEGIGVFEIRPGVIRTDMITTVEKLYEERIANGLLPQRRMGEVADVAKVVRSIADGQLDYCAGQVINADGGFHIRSL